MTQTAMSSFLTAILVCSDTFWISIVRGNFTALTTCVGPCLRKNWPSGESTNFKLSRVVGWTIRNTGKPRQTSRRSNGLTRMAKLWATWIWQCTVWWRIKFEVVTDPFGRNIGRRYGALLKNHTPRVSLRFVKTFKIKIKLCIYEKYKCIHSHAVDRIKCVVTVSIWIGNYSSSHVNFD